MATISTIIMMNTAAWPAGIPSSRVPVNFTATTKNVTAQTAASSTSPLMPSR